MDSWRVIAASITVKITPMLTNGYAADKSIFDNTLIQKNIDIRYKAIPMITNLFVKIISKILIIFKQELNRFKGILEPVAVKWIFSFKPFIPYFMESCAKTPVKIEIARLTYMEGFNLIFAINFLPAVSQDKNLERARAGRL